MARRRRKLKALILMDLIDSLMLLFLVADIH
jgi:hypothetical protein